MASFKKRPNGTYQATIYVGRDANGKQMFKYVTRDTLKECKSVAREIEQQIEDKKMTNMDNVRIVAWIEEWLELNKSRLSPSTYALYKTNYFKYHYQPFFGNMKFKQLKEIHILRFRSQKIEETSNNTTRKLLSVLKRILKDALKDKSPANDVSLPPKDDYEPYVLTDSEFELIHNGVKGTKDEPIVLLSAWCGLRRGEIFALKWDDIDWDKGLLRVDEARCITEEGKYIDGDTKSKRGKRLIVVPEYLLDLLDALRKTQITSVERQETSRSKRNKTGTRIFKGRPDNYSSDFGELIKNKNLPPIRFHDLRHYHASWLYSQGIPDQYAAQRLGHDIQVLKSIYQHLGLDKKQEIDDNIRQLYKRTSPTKCPTEM